MPETNQYSNEFPDSRVYSPFPETHWSVVLAGGVTASGSQRADEALETLCRTYWAPIYSFARARGYQPPDAEDVTQGFFTNLLEKNLISRADSERGRFRSFLLAAFKNFLSHQRDYNFAKKRGGGIAFLGLDELTIENLVTMELANSSTPETLYERAWALTLLKRALDRTDSEYRRIGEQRLFQHLQIYLQGEVPSTSHAELAELIGKTASAIKAAIHRMRKRYRFFLVEELSQTVAKFEEVEDELRHLRQILRG